MTDWYVAFLEQTERPKPEAWRSGQFVFHCLYQTNPVLARLLTATEVDPYYAEDRIPAFMQAVEAESEKETA